MTRLSAAVRWSDEAVVDLDTIWQYHSEVAGQLTADKVIRAIVKATDILTEHPFAGRSREEIRPGLRSIAASPHVIFYRVADPGAEIVRVLDGRRDFKPIFAVL